MSLEKALALRKEYRERHHEVSAEEDEKLMGACVTAIAQLSKKDQEKFHKIVEEEAEEFVKKMGSKLWSS